jgi:hypothetical protein
MKVNCHLNIGTVWSAFQIILWFILYESANWQLLFRSKITTDQQTEYTARSSLRGLSKLTKDFNPDPERLTMNIRSAKQRDGTA